MQALPRPAGIRCLAALAVAAVTLLVAFAGPAAAGIRDFRVGTVSGPPVAGPDLTRMREAGVRTLRVIFSWNFVETRRRIGDSCLTAVYGGFSRYDEMLAEAGRLGIRILPFFQGSPPYVPGGDFNNAPPTGTRAMGDYLCWVRAVVRRYGRGGTFATPNGPAQPITAWQLWNEVNLPSYAANNRVDPAEYGRFVKRSTAAIRQVDGEAKIVLAGLPDLQRTARGMDAGPYVRRLYRVGGIRAAFDAVALHPYAENARGVKEALIRMRDVLREVGDKGRILWLTEVGYASRGGSSFLVKTEQGQATHLAGTLGMIRENRRRFQIGSVHWYNWRDMAAYGSGDPWWEFAGLYRVDGTPKPACHAYRRFTGSVGPCQPIVVPPPPPPPPPPPETGAQSLLPSPPPGG